MVVVFLDSGEAVGAGGNDGGWSSGSPPKIYQFSASLKYKYILFIWRNLNISNMYTRKTGAKS